MADTSLPKRVALFVVFFICGLLVFMVGMTLSAQMPERAAGTVRVAIAVALLVAAVTCSQFPRLKEYWLVLFAFFTAALCLLMAWQFSDYGLKMFSLTTATPSGIAVAKLSEAVIVLFFVLILSVMSRTDLGSIYLQRGNLRLGLTIGIATFAILLVAGAVMGIQQKASAGRLIAWTPWVLVFVIANGFMEEILFRGLFLKRLEHLLGVGASNLLTALVFALAHISAAYVSKTLPFVGLTFGLGFLWGYIMQKTESVIGSALFHAGADVLIIVGTFAALR